eukprot:jgi/Tetstr1/453994/TSEL_040913.t1
MKELIMFGVHQWRMRIWDETKALAAGVADKPPPATKHRHDPDSVFPSGSRGAVEVTAEDSVVAGKRLKDSGLNPVVLILADEFIPGGCVDTGSGAQEECMFRMTNLADSLLYRPHLYPMKDDEAIYSPGITVLKMPEEDLYADLAPENRYRMDFIACPGLRYPRTVTVGGDGDGDGGEERLGHHDVDKLCAKIRTILQVAARRGHDAVVLGALGCGAWKSPPRHVAQIMRGILFDDHARKAFAQVTVAVRHDAERRMNRNYQVFADEFASITSGST